MEMGKPVTQGAAEVEKCASACEYFAAQATAFLAPIHVSTEWAVSRVHFVPLGTILAVMPWNFPLWQVVRCAAPALMAGNTVVLKHASNVTGCALAMGEIFAAAGLPRGVFSVLVINSKRVKAVLEDHRIQAVALTGSTEAGQSIAAKAGAALKKTVLELGGSDPYVVLEDADLERAARVCAEARLINSGQSCIAAKRFIVVRAVRDAFLARFQSHLAAARMGDPMDPQTTLGPLARSDLRDLLHAQTRESVDAGARLLLGGETPPGRGWFYPATLLADVRPGMRAFDEETFGPVAALVTAHDEAEAISLANKSSFGLGAAVFTRDVERGARIAAEELEAGACFVNVFVRSDARLPFGGVKASGYGRELGEFGIREFVNVKTVVAAA
jgi:succinate-semialdehyde dehydrogenase/glutarate-semialdehyde dehydrogenase